MPNEGINANKPKCPKCNKPYWFEGTGISDNDICSCPMPNEREVSDKSCKTCGKFNGHYCLLSSPCQIPSGNNNDFNFWQPKVSDKPIRQGDK